MSDYAATQEALADQLEDMVDTTSVASVIEALQDVCFAKAEHLRTNWQDDSTAKLWERAARALNRVRASEAIVDVS